MGQMEQKWTELDQSRLKFYANEARNSVAKVNTIL